MIFGDGTLIIRRNPRRSAVVELATLLGRNVFLGTTTATSCGANGKLLQKTYETVHGQGFYTRRRDG
jgi:hypothetical protein